MALGQYDGSIRIDTSLNTKNFNAALGKITQSVKSLGAAVGIAFGVSTLIKFGKEAIDLASDIEEVQNVVDTAFGSMSGMVEEFASTAIEKLGMSELAAKQTASTYMAMSKGMGMYGKEAAQMAIDAAARTGDIASFYNMTQKEADTLLKSIWTGETESLKRIGVVMTQTNLDQYALQKGFGKTTSAMNQQELTLLRYQYVMDKTNLAAGDFEKTQDSWANQTRVLTERWKQFLSLMGTGLIQILTPALKFLNQMMSVLLRFAEAFSKVTAAIFGKQALSTAQGAQSAVSGAAGATDDYADAVANAKKKQDKFLAGLDEITTLNEPSTAGSSASSAPAGVGDFSVPEISGEIGGDVTLSPALQKVIDTVTGFFDKLKQIDLEPAKQALDKLLKALGRFGEVNLSVLEWLWNDILLPMTEWTIEDFIPAFLELLADIILFLCPIIESGKDALSWFWKEWLEPIAKWKGDMLILNMNLLGFSLEKIGKFLDEHQDGLTEFFKILLLSLSGPLLPMLRLLAELWDKSGAASLNSRETMEIAWSTAGTWISDNVTTPISTTFSEMWENTKKTFSPAVTWFSSLFGSVKKTISDTFYNISVIFSGCWDIAKKGAENAWENIKTAFSPMANWFRDKFSDAWEKVKNVFSTGGQVFSGITEGISKMFKKVVNKLIDGLNRVIAMPFNSINNTLDRLRKAEIVGIKPFANLRNISIPQIPKLATGAVIPPNAEFAAILGDQKHGRNLEAPEGLIRQIVKEESGANLTVVLQMPNGEEKEVFSTKNLTKTNRQNGKILIPITEV